MSAKSQKKSLRNTLITLLTVLVYTLAGVSAALSEKDVPPPRQPAAGTLS